MALTTIPQGMSEGGIESEGVAIDGGFVKYKSGFMIVYGVATVNISSWVSSGGVFRRDAGAFSFPAAFLAGTKPSINLNTDVSEVFASPRSRSNTGTASTLWTYSGSVPTGSYDVYFDATGRWK